MKWNRILIQMTIAIAICGSGSQATAQYQIPQMYMPDTAKYSNGGMASELCKRYIYHANIKPNNPTLKQLSLYCQNLQLEYAGCVIQTRPENLMICMENASAYLPTLAKYLSYLPRS
jgi:hypothetical protein